MNVKFINPFLEGTISVLQTMAFIEATAGKPYLKKDNVAKGDVTGIIGITGQATGTISVSFDSGSILKIVSSMFGEDITQLTAEVSDAVGELTNMISGQARRNIEASGKKLEAAIPSVITGKNHTIAHVTDCSVVAVPFATDGGSFTVEMCLEN